MYGMNECRDLLFHVEEHRYRLPQVKDMAAEAGLEPLGLAGPPAVARAFIARFGLAHTRARPSTHGMNFDAGSIPTRSLAKVYILWLRGHR